MKKDHISIVDIIEEFNKDNSRTHKEQTLLKYKDNELFRRILKMTYDSSYVYNIKKLPEYENGPAWLMFEEALDIIEKDLVKKQLRGNEAYKLVKDTLSSLEEKEALILRNIILKDLKIGINKKTINKLLPGLLKHVGYMGAVPYSRKRVMKLFREHPCIFIQTKMDGEYMNLIVKDNVVGVTRNNKPMRLPETFIDAIPRSSKEKIYNGELIIKGYDRYTSNGLLTRLFKYYDYLDNEDPKQEKALAEMLAIANVETLEDLLERLRYIIWDYIDTDLPYIERVLNLVDDDILDSCYVEFVETIPLIRIKKNPQLEHIFSLVKYFQTPEDAEKYAKQIYLEKIKHGEEGIIAKACDGMWVDKKPTYQVKYKIEFEVDLRVTGFNQGNPTGKFANTLGSFQAATEDLQITADPGGIDEDIRDEVWNNKDKYLGAIITVKCNGISMNNKGELGLLHPSFVKFRWDKDKADTMEDVFRIQKSILEIAD